MIWALLLVSSLWIKESGSVWTSAVSCMHHSFPQQKHPPAHLLLFICLGLVLAFFSHLGCEFCGPVRFCVCTATQDIFHNPGHFLQFQEPLPLENSLKCIMTFNIFSPSFSSLHPSAWWWGAQVLHGPSGTCLLLRLLWASAATTNVLTLALQHLNLPSGCRGHKMSLCRHLLGGISMREGLRCK